MRLESNPFVVSLSNPTFVSEKIKGVVRQDHHKWPIDCDAAVLWLRCISDGCRANRKDRKIDDGSG